MNSLIENLETAFSDYSDKADIFISNCKRFQNNDTFTGEKATVIKNLVGNDEVGIVNAQKDMQAKALAMYKHAVESFADKVDSAPNARLDFDTLDMVESDLKAIYSDVDTTCAEIETIAKEMHAKYGHLGHITVPDANPLRESLEELCGGYNPEAGFYHDLKQKIIDWDEEECAYIDSLNLDIELSNIKNNVTSMNNLQSNIFNITSSGVLKTIETVTIIKQIINSTLKETIDDKIDLNQDKVCSVLQNKYCFSDNELLFLRTEYYSLLIAMYLALKNSDFAMLEKCEDIIRTVIKEREKTIQLPWYRNVFQLDKNLSDEYSLESRLINLGWTQEKVDKLWEYCGYIYDSYSINIDPRIMLAIIIQEGTGSFNTNSKELAIDGQNGPESDFEKDISKALNLIMGKTVGYSIYWEDFENCIKSNDSMVSQNDGGIFDYYNWKTPIVKFDSNEIESGVYACHSVWGDGVESIYESFAYKGAAEDYTNYVRNIDDKLIQEITKEIDKPVYDFKVVNDGQTFDGKINNSLVVIAEK